MKLLFTTILGLCLFLLIPNPAFAGNEFISDYLVSYTVSEDDSVLVKQEITLTNNTDDYYASEYKLTINSNDISEVKASDNEGEITVGMEKTADSIQLVLPFNKQITGKNKKLKFELQYVAEDISRTFGRGREINIPKIVDNGSINNYLAKVLVPESFGDPVMINPKPTETNRLGESIIFDFDKASLSEFGAILSFGADQFYQLELTYHLKNPTTKEVVTEIALPFDRYGNQEIGLVEFTESPQKIYIDNDGNSMATYKLKPNEVKDIKFRGTAHVQIPNTVSDSKLLSTNIPSDIRETYTKAQPYWEVSDQSIKVLSNEIAGVTPYTVEKAKLIYKYVVSELKYSKDRLATDSSRWGALKALENKNQAVCMEFADLTIALLRAQGIPAREIDGYAFTPDTDELPLIGDVLHSWVEFYVPEQGWIQIDPTWGSTTKGMDYFHRFDAYHLGFSIKGIDSQWPYPAGAYKIDPQQSGDVNVKFATDEEINKFNSAKPDLLINKNLSVINIAPLPQYGNITLVNGGERTAYIDEVVLFDNGAKISSVANSITIPAKATIEESFSIPRLTPLSFGFKNYTLVLNQGNKNVGEFQLKQLVIPIFPALGLGIFGVALGYWLYRRRCADKNL